VCPDCGEETEIYSRITGYYRPVQNWNDGKVQEFKDRQAYTTSCIDMYASCRNDIILFGTKTCPNCIQAEKILNNAGITFVKVLAEDKPELVASLKIMQAPTLIVRNRIKNID
jgi:ribonucleoside-triphosphate reductase